MKDACLTAYALLICEARTLLSVLDDPLAVGWYLFPNHKDGSTPRGIDIHDFETFEPKQQKSVQSIYRLIRLEYL